MKSFMSLTRREKQRFFIASKDFRTYRRDAIDANHRHTINKLVSVTVNIANS